MGLCHRLLAQARLSPGSAQTLLPFPSTAALCPHPDGTHQVALGAWGGSLAHRQGSAVSQQAPSPATHRLELSGCSEADQRISDKLERLKKRATVGINTSAVFYGYRTLSIIQQELVEVAGDGKALNFYTFLVCRISGFDLLHFAKGGS